MPLTEAGFQTSDRRPDNSALVNLGPTLQVIVTHMPTDDAVSVPSETVHALIDTGALESCIDVDLATRLELPIVDSCEIAGVHGVEECPLFMAWIDIPQLASYQYGRFSGVQLAKGGHQHDVLLGRTFLQGAIMIYDGLRAQVTLSSPNIASRRGG